MRSFIRYSLLAGSLIPALASAFTPISLSPGWNLVGNSDPAAIDVTTKLSGTQIVTVWKWNKVGGKWAFYTPSMSSTQLAAYAVSKGYDVLSTIDSKEGFWVNANAAIVISDTLSPPPTTGTVTLSAADLDQGWNLMGSADKKTPSQLNADLNSSLNAASKSINTLWAWDAGTSSWRFYAPSLEANSQLSSYITSKKYLSFTGVLAATDGFWINVGVPTTPLVPPLTGAEGMYAGTLTGSQSTAFEMIVLENGEYWSLYGTQYASMFSVSGLAQGTGSANNGSFTSANLKDFGFAPAASGTVSATYNATSKTIAGTLSEAIGTVSFSGGSPAGSLYNYNTAASLTTIAGAWSTSSLSGESIALSISSNGTFTASSNTGCHFSGTFAPRASGKNVFNVAATFGPAPCALPGVAATGIAIATPLSNGKTELIAAAVEGTRNYGAVVFGTR